MPVDRNAAAVERMRRHRETTGRVYDRARNKAFSQLRLLHRAEFDALLAANLREANRSGTR